MLWRNCGRTKYSVEREGKGALITEGTEFPCLENRETWGTGIATR
jgi:hypothetical protein